MAQTELSAKIVLGGRVDNTFTKLGNKIQALGTLVNQVGDKITSLYKDSVDVYKDYEYAMTEAESTLASTYTNAGELNTVMKNLETHAKNWAATTIFHTDDVANAIASAAHAGWDYEKIVEGLPAAMLAAQAGSMDLSETVDMLAKMLASTNTEFDDATEFIDMWARAADLVATDIPELGDAFIRLGAAAQFADSNEELFTMLAVLANVGTVGEAAGTGIRAMMLRLIAPTAKATDVMDAMGASTEELEEAMEGVDAASEAAYESLQAAGFSPYDEQGNLKGFIQMFKELDAALQTMGTEEEQNAALAAIFPTRTIAYAQAMLAAVRNGTIDTIYNSIGDSEGYGTQKAETMMDTLYGDIEILASAFENLKLKIGETLAPTIRTIATSVTDLLNGIAGMDQTAFDAFVMGLGGLAFSGTTMLVVGKMVEFVGYLTAGGWKIALAAAGIAAIAGAVVALNESANQNFLSNFGDLNLDSTTLNENIDSITESFTAAYTEVNKYAEALDTAVASYTAASQTMTTDLLNSFLTGATLSESQIASLQSLGTQMGDELKAGISASFSQTAAYLEMLYGGVESMEADAGYLQDITLMEQVRNLMLTEAENLGKDFSETLNAALEDSIVTGDEYAIIKKKMDALNEAMSYAKNAEQAGEDALMLHKAQSVSWDSFSDYAAYVQSAYDTVAAQDEEEFWRNYGQQKYNYALAIENGLLKEDGTPYTQADWDARDKAYREQYRALVTSRQETYSGFMESAIDALMTDSEYADAWALFKAYQGTDNLSWLDTGSGGRALDFSSLTEGDVWALSKKMGGFIGVMYQLQEMMAPYGSEEYGNIGGEANLFRNLLNTYINTVGVDAAKGNGEAAVPLEIAVEDEELEELDSKLEAGATYTVHVETDYGLGYVPGGADNTGWSPERMGTFANGGRATTASIFGEAGAEWAIPEEHSLRTAALLDAARRASGFTWGEILQARGGLNAGGAAAGGTLVYSPTIYAQDASGVAERLREDKERLEKWWRERALRERVEVYQ